MTIGTVGSASANLWPVYIGLKKGFFAAEDLKLDIVFVAVERRAGAAACRRLARHRHVDRAGRSDPRHRQGAPIAIVRLEVQAPPYALVGQAGIKTLEELKGKVISVGGAKDITRIYVERMLAPNGVKPGEFDMVFAGATSARASALLAGAVDAAILLPPFNFQAEAQGFTNLGLTVDYAPELPFSGTVVNKAWAARNQALAAADCCGRTPRASPGSRTSKNRDEAIAILVEASSLKPDDVDEVLRLLPRRTVLRADRQGVANEDCNALARARWTATRRCCPARSTSSKLRHAGRDPDRSD